MPRSTPTPKPSAAAPAPAPPAPRRADAARNREKILAVARRAFAESDGDVSMAEVSRRAGVGMATLYRNFPGRRELLEALYTEEVDAVCAPAPEGEGKDEGEGAGAAFVAWLRRFVAFSTNKRQIAAELLTHVDSTNPVFNENRDRVLAAGRPLLAAAQASGEIRADLSLEQILDMVIAIVRISGDAEYVGPILEIALEGLRG
jgi:AcrR family transcriptional regulator